MTHLMLSHLRNVVVPMIFLVEKYLERFSAITKREMLIQSTWKQNPGKKDKDHKLLSEPAQPKKEDPPKLVHHQDAYGPP